MSHWYARAAQALLQKTLSELLFEEALVALPCSEGYEVTLGSGVRYQFSAQQSIWGQLLIEPGTVLRNEQQASCPLQLLVDAQTELALTDIILANLIEETANTLAADTRLLEQRDGLSAGYLADLPYNAQQAYLDGHPKAIANKGRMGWGIAEHCAYAPEHNPEIRLHWLATRSEHLRSGLLRGWSPEMLLRQSLNDTDLEKVARQLGGDLRGWQFIPVHPWQWQHKIQTLFAAALAERSLISLGELGDAYLPQQSLRTLGNRIRPLALDIKLPITVLNTSCYRGIPARYIEVGPEISRWLQSLCDRDPELCNTHILQEVAGIHYPQAQYQQISASPYRFHEMLGAIWREPVSQYLKEGQQAVMLGALWQLDNDAQPLLQHWLQMSQLTLSDWLQRLFDVMVVPLYHLMCAHGVALVAHGQNITVILQQGVPVAVSLKDFQGDLRLSDTLTPAHQELTSSAFQALDRLPDSHLIHDLQTGNFVTALRFLSAMCWQLFKFSEMRFYQLLSDSLARYKQRQPQLQREYERFDLFQPQIPKLCINRVRLQLGYDDSAQRPQMLRGRDMRNPLFSTQNNELSI